VTLMFILLLLFGISMLAIAAFVVWYMGLIKKFGLPDLPEDIELIDREMDNACAVINTDTYESDIEREERRTFLKSFQTKDGIWNVKVEVEGNRAVAYQAILHHSKSRWLDSTREKWTKQPKIIRIIGND